MNSIWSGMAPSGGVDPFTTKAGASPHTGGVAGLPYSLSPASSQAKPGIPNPSSPLPDGAASAAASGGTGSSNPSTSAGAITANDFLTLLVTEMQNQDPTSQTDPNQYISQLTQINSLEQLISINQDLQAVLGAATTPPTSGASGTSGAGNQAPPAVASNKGSGAAPVGAQQVSSRSPSSPSHGNLSLPKTSQSAQTVAHALDGHRRAPRPGHAIRDIPTH